MFHVEQLQFQVATAEDANILVPLIHETLSHFNFLWMTKNKEKQINYIKQAFLEVDNIFSYKYTKKFYLDGIFIGLATSYPDALCKKLTKKFDEVHKKMIGHFFYYLLYILHPRYYFLTEGESGDYYIQHIAIVESMRRKGLASLILKELEKEARRFGMKQLALITDDKNKTAIHFYHASGFTCVHRNSFHGWHSLKFVRPLY